MGGRGAPPSSAPTLLLLHAGSINTKNNALHVMHTLPSNTCSPVAGIYEYGNNGGLIVMAPHKSEGPSDVVQASLGAGCVGCAASAALEILGSNAVVVQWPVLCNRLARAAGYAQGQAFGGDGGSRWVLPTPCSQCSAVGTAPPWPPFVRPFTLAGCPPLCCCSSAATRVPAGTP